MIEANSINTKKLSKAYDFRSSIYDKTIAVSEFKYHEIALDKIKWDKELTVLEVATGPGRVLLEIALRLGKSDSISGLDLSQKMLKITHQRLSKHGFNNIDLKNGDARHLPWPDNHFDIVYSGYMMDLIPLADMDQILNEMYRVIKPGGKLILVNMSKASIDDYSFLEHIYQLLPGFIVLHIMGNCRPVLMEQHVLSAGFTDIERDFHGGKHPTEIIVAQKGVSHV